MFRVGDKVRFLNEEGGGVVSKIISPNMVNVSIEDGFEIPTLISDLIKVDPGQGFYKHAGIPEKEVAGPDIAVEEVSEFGRTDELGKIPGAKPRSEGIYLAFYPRDQKWLLTGRMDIFLVNYTAYEILFSLFLKDDQGYKGQDYDGVQPHSKILLKTIQREETANWSKGILQVIFHKDRVKEVLLPLHSKFNIKETRFLKEDNYSDSPFLEGKSFLLQLGIVSGLSEPQGIEKQNLPEAVEKVAKEVKEESFLQKHIKSDDFAEIDLHIGKLRDDSKSMDDHEIVNYQMNYFMKGLEEGLSRDISRMVFIHGIGKGRLRQKMMETLKEYDNLKVLDANYREYGMGAIEVRIRASR